MRNSAVSMERQSVAYSMKAFARSALRWPKARPKARRPLAITMVDRLDKSDGLDPQFAKLRKELTLAQREISNLKNQLHQAKQNIAKKHAERCSKSKKDDLPDEEVDSKRIRQQAKRAKASRPET